MTHIIHLLLKVCPLCFSKPVAGGNQALKYLAPYIYRVAITNNRIKNLEKGQVRFRFKNAKTKQW